LTRGLPLIRDWRHVSALFCRETSGWNAAFYVIAKEKNDQQNREKSGLI
jgi:hypothetical protein